MPGSSVIDRGVPPLSFDESAGFAAPSAFGAYRVLHQIGSGVLGPVFRTYEPQRDRLIAVKAFRLDIVPEQVARLADALRRLVASDVTHPAIVGAIDAGLEGTTAYLAMDYVAAETLDVALRHLAPSPLDRAWPILAQIAEAIEAAWAKGAGHGALHPRDVFVTSATNDVRVSGFGVVPALESVGIKPPIRRPYAAPERGTADAWDIRADVYSLGAIAHELLTRRRPAGPSEQDGALVTGTTPEQRVLIRRVLSAALAERPEHRFATPSAFVAALDAIVKGEPLGPLPVGSEVQGDEADAPRAPERSITPSTPIMPAMPIVLPLDEPIEARTVDPVDELVAEPDPEPAIARSPSEHSERPRPARFEPRSDPAIPIAPVSATRTPPAVVPERPKVATASERGPVHPAYSGSLASRKPPSYPWAAIVAAMLAGIALGSVVTYRVVRVVPVATSVTVAPPLKPNDTEVTVPPEPVPVVSPPAQAASQAPPPETPPSSAATPGQVPAAAVPSAPAAGRNPAAGSAQGRVLVRSIPSGATLSIDGHGHGATPATVRDLSLGTHTLLVSHPGYTTHTEKLTLTADQPARNVTIELKPARSGRGAVRPATRTSGGR